MFRLRFSWARPRPLRRPVAGDILLPVYCLNVKNPCRTKAASVPHSGLKIIAYACNRRNGGDVIKLLLDKGANVNDTDERPWTALMWAVSMWNVDNVRLLVERKTDLTVRSKEEDWSHGQNAIGMARRHDFHDIIGIFISKPAPPAPPAPSLPCEVPVKLAQ